MLMLVSGCSVLFAPEYAVEAADADVVLIDVDGDYSGRLVAQENDCEIEGWVPGAISTDIVLELSQTQRSLIADVTGWSGLTLDLLVGSHTLAGTIDGDQIRLAVPGTQLLEPNSPCTHKLNARIEATFADDTLDGDVFFDLVYEPGKGADCPAPVGCTNGYTLSATRL